MKKISGLLLTFGSFLALEAGAASMWDGPQAVHHKTGPKVDHKLAARQEAIRKAINDAHKSLSRFSEIYKKMHDMRVEVEAMNAKTPDQRHLLKLEKEWIAAQTKLRLALITHKVKVSVFDSLPSERDIWANFPDGEARSLEATLHEIRRWQSYENINLNAGQAKQSGNLYDEGTPTSKSMNPRSMRFSDLKKSDSDDEDF